MNFRQKLAYTALGGGLMLIGMLLTTITPLTAQKDVFGDITCSSLTVVDKEGNAVIDLKSNENGGVVEVYDKDGKDGTAKVRLNTNIYGDGVVGLFAKEGFRWILLHLDEHGGVVEVLGKDGMAVLSNTKSGSTGY